MGAITADPELAALPELGLGEAWEGPAWEDEFSLAGAGNLARRGWNWLSQPGSWQRRAALAAARSALPAAGQWAGSRIGGWVGPEGVPIGGLIGDALGTAGASLLPDQEWESEFGASGEFGEFGELEGEFEGELNPTRKIYLDAMLEHMAHQAMEAQHENDAVEGFLPLIPLLAAKVLPLAAKALPLIGKLGAKLGGKVAGKVLPKLAQRVVPRIARTFTRNTPNLSRGISNITRTLYRNPQTRPLVRAVPSIAQRTMASLARQAAAGRNVTPQQAQRVLAAQTYRVLSRPGAAQTAMRRNTRLDRQYHGGSGLAPAVSPMPMPGAMPAMGGIAAQLGAPPCINCGAPAAVPAGVLMPAQPAFAPGAWQGGPRYRCRCCSC